MKLSPQKILPVGGTGHRHGPTATMPSLVPHCTPCTRHYTPPPLHYRHYPCMVQISGLNLSHNLLEGEVLPPDWVSSVTKTRFKWLDRSDNRGLTGTLPDSVNWVQMPYL